MLRLEKIEKSFKKKPALNNISTTLDKGVIGFLGPNGAGKTTLLRIIATTLLPSSGSLYWDEQRIEKKNLPQYRNLLGYMPQELRFYEFQTVNQYLKYIEVLDGVSEPAMLKDLIDETLGLLNLLPQRDEKIKSLSGGMKRRLGFSQAIIRHPKILILDEPTVGLDPNERNNLRRIIYNYGKDNVVLLSTHLTEDVESICDRVFLMEKGSIIADTNVSKMIEKASGHIFEKEKLTSSASSRKEEIISERNIGGTEIQRYISIECNHDGDTSSILVTPSLEDAYLYHRYLYKKEMAKETSYEKSSMN